MSADRIDADPPRFFREFYPQLYRYASAQTAASPADVDDVVQETLLQAWRGRASFRGDSSPGTWLVAILKNRLRDLRRRERRDKDGAIRAILRMDVEDLPEPVLESAELGARVRRALQALPPESADLLTARYLEGEAVRRIAERLGQSEEAVESRLRRAREALKKLMQDGVDEDE